MNKLLKTRLLFFLMCNCYAFVMFAQDTGKNKQLIHFFSTIQKNYQEAKNLSFSVKYIYTDEQKPDKILDTLSGSYKINGNHYWCRMDSTETMKNDSLVIILFRQDKLMYLRKAPNKQGFDPVEQMNTFLNTYKTVKFRIDTLGKSYVLTVDFPETLDYKKITLSVDKISGLLTRSVYIIRTRLLMDRPDNEESENSSFGEYARVQADYLNYSNDSMVNALYDETNFIQRRGNKITTTEQYKDFKLFFGSSNL